jgi:hypothetical protein
MTIAQSPTSRRMGLYLLSLSLVAVICAIHLPFPFRGDQALFATAAIEISDGGWLYTDFWDLKQPGIFLFFVAAGTLFGYTEVGIHLFELIYWLAFSVVLLATMGRQIKTPAFAALLPVLSIGTYYAISGSSDITQLEALAAFPIFVSMWLAYRAADSAKPFLILAGSGLAGGIAVVFKLLFLVLLVPFWLRSVAERSSRSGKSVAESLVGVANGVGVGILIPLGFVTALLSNWGALGIGLDTFFRIPPRILAELPGAPLERLVRSAAFFMRSYGPMVLLVLAGVWMLRRSAMDRLTKYLWSWCLFGAVVILLQRQSWWLYHFQLIGFPLALLAVLTLDKLRMQPLATFKDRRSRSAVRFGVLVAFLALPMLLALGRPAVSLIQYRLALDPADRAAFQNRFSSGEYGEISEDVQFLDDPGASQGDIYVAGNPLYYWLSGRGQATSLNGWALEFFLVEQWDELASQLEASQAPYVFVSNRYSDLIGVRGEPFADVLDLKYFLLRTSREGTWYELVSPDAALAQALGQ